MKKAVFSILKGDLARSGSQIFLASLSANIILFFANIFIADQLGPTDFGTFKILVYLFTFLPFLADLGAKSSLTKFISEFKATNKDKVDYLVKWFLKVRIFSFSVLMALTLIFHEQISLLFLKDASLSYLIFPSMLLAGMTFFTVFQYIVLGFQKFKMFAFSQFLTFSSSAILGSLLSPFGNFYIITGWSFGFLIGNILNIKFFFEKDILNKSKEFDIKKIFIKFSIPVYLIEITTNLFTAVIPVLSIFFPQDAIGYFSFAFIFYFAALLVPQSISSVVFPKVSELNGLKKHGEARGILKKAFLLYAPVALVGILFVLLVSDWFFASFFEKYLPSLFMFKILVSIGLIFGFNIIYTFYLQGLGRVKSYAFFVLLQNILLFAVSFALLSMF
jgi:O-antigen/teichoic acid export membrane protein